MPVEAVKVEITELAAFTSAEEITALLERESAVKFNFWKGPLMQVKIGRLENDGCHIIITIDHIIADGASVGVLKDEMLALYNANITGSPSGLRPLPFQYSDFARWQQAFVNSPGGVRHREYWLQKLDGCVPRLTFPLRVDPQQQGVGISLTAMVDTTLYNTMRLFAQEHRLTVPVLLMGALCIVAGKSSARNDMVLLTQTAGRHSSYYGNMDVTGLIGLFANTLALRTVVDKRKSNLQYLHELQTGFLSDLGYSAYPFIKLVDELTGVDPSALANASLLFNYQQYDHVKDVEQPEDDGGTPVKIVSEQNDIVLSVSEFKNCLQVRFVMNRQIFDAALALEIKALYFLMLRSMIDHPQWLVQQVWDQLPVISNDTKHAVM
jgi:hypothetical protein